MGSNSAGYATVPCAAVGYQRFTHYTYKSPTVPIHIVAVEYCWLGFEVPKGYHIHHLDHDRGNWHLANLALLTETQHHLHGAFGEALREYYTPEELRQFTDENIARARQEITEGTPIRRLVTFDDFRRMVQRYSMHK